MRGGFKAPRIYALSRSRSRKPNKLANNLEYVVNANRQAASAWAYLGLSLLTIIDAFAPAEWLVLSTVALILIYVVLEIRRVPRAQQISAAVLIAIGIAAAAKSGNLQDAFVDGVARARIFLLLFFAVAWLQFPVGQSPALQATRGAILNQPSGRRFLILSFGVHILGAVLNLAGLALLTTTVEKQTDPKLRRRLTLALMQGFTSASCWSPFYIGMVVVLVAIPTIQWSDVAPTGAVISILIIMAGWFYDRISHRSGTAQPVGEGGVIAPALLIRAFILLATLMAMTMWAVDVTGATIPVALAIVGPPFALIWQSAIDWQYHHPATSSAGLINKVVARLPTLRNESIMFVAANIFGVGLASIIPKEDLGVVLDAVLPWPDARIVVLILFFQLCAMAGLHAVIVVIFLTAVLPPEVLGLPDWIVGLTYLGAWGLSTMVSPFSGTTLFMSRVTGVPGYVIGWRWAPGTAYLGAFVVAVSMIVVRHWAG